MRTAGERSGRGHRGEGGEGKGLQYTLSLNPLKDARLGNAFDKLGNAFDKPCKTFERTDDTILDRVREIVPQSQAEC